MTSTLLDRYTSAGGRRRLVDALCRQKLICGNAHLAEAIAQVAEIVTYSPGEVLILQDGADNELFYLLAGSVRVRVSGRDVAKRFAETHVGEMACIDPKARRCATVTAIEHTVAARVSEEHIDRIARNYPELWRSMACELAERLRQRNNLVRPVNEQSKLLVASSREGLEIARVIETGLDHDPILVDVWTNDVFQASHVAIEDLERKFDEADFVVLVVTPDDELRSRSQVFAAPRDNIIFELGLAMGAVTRERTIMVMPRDPSDIKMPSDLLGLKPLTFKHPSRMGAVCTEIRKRVARLGPR